MFWSRTIRNRTDLFFGTRRRTREFPRSQRLLRIVPLEERSLLSVSDGEDNTAYTYDSVIDKVTRYYYDANDHLIDELFDGQYDPNNHTGYSQVLKTTEYSIDGETRTITKEIFYTIGLDQIAQSVTAYIDGIAQETETHYFTYDGHGSTRALLDTTAVIIQLYSGKIKKDRE